MVTSLYEWNILKQDNKQHTFNQSMESLRAGVCYFCLSFTQNGQWRQPKFLVILLFCSPYNPSCIKKYALYFEIHYFCWIRNRLCSSSYMQCTKWVRLYFLQVCFYLKYILQNYPVQIISFCLFVCLFVWDLTSHSRIHSYGDVTTTVKGL